MVAAALQQSPDPDQLAFQRYLKCKEPHNITDALANALRSSANANRGSVETLAAPSSVLPPMF